jgi:hypothetical protein
MADTKISALTASTTPLAGTEVLPIVQSGTTKQVSVANLTAGRSVSMLYLDILSTAGLLGNLNSTNANGGFLRWQTNSTSIADIGSAKQVFNTGSANDFGIGSRGGYYFGLGANGAESLRLTTTGDVSALTGNFVVGTSGKGITTGSAINLGFGTNGSANQATLFSSGGVSIGNTTDPGASNLFVTGSVLCGGSSTSYGNLSSQTISAGGFAIGAQTSGAGAALYGGWSSTTAVYTVFGNGNVVNTNNSYGAISDAKLKENIVDATPKLDDLMKIRVVNYNLKKELGFEQHKQIGVIAQELEEIFPGLVESYVDVDKDGNQLNTQTKSVKMTLFIPMLIKAIQEQQQIIEQLKAKVGL